MVLLAGLVLLAGSRAGLFAPLENATLNVTSPVEQALQDITRPFADFVNNITDVNRISDENQALKEENERLVAENARLQEVEGEAQDLRNQLDIRDSRPEDTFVEAQVFAREPSNARAAIAIDQGKNDGIVDGMVVLTRQGSLIGTVTEALDDVAWVTLITDPASAVSARVQSSRVEGVVVGETDGSLTLEFVERTADVNEDDLVLTSGIGGNYPAGELIGSVVEIDRAAQELFQGVNVEPLADLSSLEAVLVLTSFTPLDGDGP
jgi:rod shape-determining protein MreC